MILLELVPPAGEVAILYATIDREDYWHAQFAWRWARHGHNREKVYAYRKVKSRGGVWTKLYLHRAIMDPPDGMVVDHVNGDTLDNRRGNLRNVGYRENAYNVAPKQLPLDFPGLPPWREVPEAVEEIPF